MRAVSGSAEPIAYLLPGTAAYRAVARALFAAGLATFAILYCVQPLMPVFSEAFGVSPAASTLSLSLTTGMLAPMLLVASAISDTIGRKKMIVGSIAASSLLTLAAAAAPSWSALLVFRLLEGITLSGLQAVAMAYLGEEVAPEALGYAMGLFVSGSGIGGLAGRLFAGFTGQAVSWRFAMAAIGVLSLLAGAYVWRALPPSRHFRPRRFRGRAILSAIGAHLSDPTLRALYAISLLNMGAFVTVYNLITYRLLAPPYSLPPPVVGAVFVIYLVGTVASTMMGRLADRVGVGPVLIGGLALAFIGIVITLASSLPLVILGVAALTAGFFGAHSVASGWVSRRARMARAQATGLYLFFFYLGSSVVASLSGLAWSGGGWPGVAAVACALLVAGMAIALALYRAARGAAA